MTKNGYCRKGGCNCDGDSFVCCLSGSGKQYEYSFKRGRRVAMSNSECCHFCPLDMPVGRVGGGRHG